MTAILPVAYAVRTKRGEAKHKARKLALARFRFIEARELAFRAKGYGLRLAAVLATRNSFKDFQKSVGK